MLDFAGARRVLEKIRDEVNTSELREKTIMNQKTVYITESENFLDISNRDPVYHDIYGLYLL